MSHNQLAGHKRKISFAELTDTFRRAGPMIAPPPHQNQPPQLTAADIQRQQLERTRQAELARRQSKKPTDREIPDELGEVIVGDGVEKYKQLRDVERKLDATMMRKRLDVTDNLQRRYTRREGVLRVWVSNTAEGQPWQVVEDGTVGLGEDGTFDFGESQATFRVKLEGRLLDDPEEKDDSEEGEKEAKRPRLSNFFKAITIDFDRNPALQPDGYSQIEWKKPTGPNADVKNAEANFDTLEFERKADENINVTISMYRDEKSERYKLSPQLAEILDAEEEDRAGAVQGIWEYCRAMGLQEDEDRRSIVCDEPLRKVSFLQPARLFEASCADQLPSSSTRTPSTSPTSPSCWKDTTNLSHRSNSTTPSAWTKSTSTPAANPPSTISASLSPTLCHPRCKISTAARRTSPTSRPSSPPMTIWRCSYRNCTTPTPSGSSSRTWPRIRPTSSSDGRAASSGIWRSSSPSTREEVGMMRRVRSSGAVAGVVFGVARMRGRVLDCGLPRARRRTEVCPRYSSRGAGRTKSAVARLLVIPGALEFER